jgi:hypothetical protein
VEKAIPMAWSIEAQIETPYFTVDDQTVWDNALTFWDIIDLEATTHWDVVLFDTTWSEESGL